MTTAMKIAMPRAMRRAFTTAFARAFAIAFESTGGKVLKITDLKVLTLSIKEGAFCDRYERRTISHYGGGYDQTRYLAESKKPGTGR
jgi:hypothetical protein